MEVIVETAPPDALEELEARLQRHITPRADYRHLDAEGRLEQKGWNNGVETCIKELRKFRAGVA